MLDVVACATFLFLFEWCPLFARWEDSKASRPVASGKLSEPNPEARNIAMDVHFAVSAAGDVERRRRRWPVPGRRGPVTSYLRIEGAADRRPVSRSQLLERRPKRSTSGKPKIAGGATFILHDGAEKFAFSRPTYSYARTGNYVPWADFAERWPVDERVSLSEPWRYSLEIQGYVCEAGRFEAIRDGGCHFCCGAREAFHRALFPTRASLSWSLTRNWRNPSARNSASPRSTSPRRSGVTSVP